MNKAFMEYAANPRLFTLRKWLYDLLKLDYAKHDAVVERISVGLTNQSDLEDFGKLVGAIYENGYRKALEDYRGKVEAMGIKVEID